jgi:hypothetical protein
MRKEHLSCNRSLIFSFCIRLRNSTDLEPTAQLNFQGMKNVLISVFSPLHIVKFSICSGCPSTFTLQSQVIPPKPAPSASQSLASSPSATKPKPSTKPNKSPTNGSPPIHSHPLPSNPSANCCWTFGNNSRRRSLASIRSGLKNIRYHVV